MNDSTETMHVYTDNEISWELWLKRIYSVSPSYRRMIVREDDFI